MNECTLEIKISVASITIFPCVTEGDPFPSKACDEVHNTLTPESKATTISNRWEAMALPTSNVENSTNEDDDLGLMLKDQTISEPALVFLMRRRSTGLASNIQDDKGTQLHMLSDLHLKGQDTSRSIPGFKLTDWNSGPFPKTVNKMDRRNSDLDVLRCMIGRVYRPCWEA